MTFFMHSFYSPKIQSLNPLLNSSKKRLMIDSCRTCNRSSNICIYILMYWTTNREIIYILLGLLFLPLWVVIAFSCCFCWKKNSTEKNKFIIPMFCFPHIRNSTLSLHATYILCYAIISFSCNTTQAAGAHGRNSRAQRESISLIFFSSKTRRNGWFSCSSYWWHKLGKFIFEKKRKRRIFSKINKP